MPLAAPPRSANGEGTRARDLGRFGRYAFLGGALVLLATVLAISAYWLHSERRLVEAHLAAAAAALTNELAGRTAAVRAQLERWRQDPGLQVALSDGRPALLQAKEAELRGLLPGIVGVSLFTPDMVGPGASGGESLSYAGVEMVRDVMASGQTSMLEAHRVQQPDAHLAIAAPVLAADGGSVLGVVHVRLPLGMLPSRAVDAEAGTRFLFQQRVGSELVNLQAVSSPPPADLPPTRQDPVPNTSLLLSAWAMPPDLRQPALVGWLGGIYLLATGALALVLWLAGRSLGRALRSDLEGLYAVLDDAMQRKPLRSPRLRLTPLVELHERLQRLLRELTPSRSVPPPAPVDLAALAADTLAPSVASDGLSFDLELDPATAPAPGTPPEPLRQPVASPPVPVPAHIFRANDIRGRVGEDLDDGVLTRIGLALGSETRARGGDTVVVGRDQRPSSAGLSRALVQGLLDSGVTVIDLGLVPTPLLYFACAGRGNASGAMVTGSHNPAGDNGVKLVLVGQPATDTDIAGLAARLHRADFTGGQGEYRTETVIDDYVAAVERDIALARGLKVAVDCGNATAALVAPRLLRTLGCDLVELDCDCDGALADRQMPDPVRPSTLYNLCDTVRSTGADLGVAFDADGDRLGLVDAEGQIITMDRVLMLLAGDVLARQPASDILFDVKCSHRLAAEILRQGGRPVMGKSGHAFLKARLRELGAPLAGEFSGHVVFGDRWNGYDDAFYAAARVLEVLALDPRDSHQIFAALPIGIATEEMFLPMARHEASGVMAAVLAMGDRLEGVEINAIDGLRAEFDQGWGLVRTSNTQDGLVFRFEADDPHSLERIQNLFRRMLNLVAPQLELPF